MSTQPTTQPTAGSSDNRPRQMGPGPMGRGGPMGHGPMGMMKGEKPRDTRGTVRKLLTYLGRYKLLILVVWLFAIASTVATIVGPKILGNATTALFEGSMAQMTGTGSIDFTYIGQILLKVLYAQLDGEVR